MKMLTRRAKPIRITSVRINGILLNKTTSKIFQTLLKEGRQCNLFRGYTPLTPQCPQEPATNKSTILNHMNPIHIAIVYFYIHFNIIWPPISRAFRHIVFRSSYRSHACCLLCPSFAVDLITQTTFGENHASLLAFTPSLSISSMLGRKIHPITFVSSNPSYKCYSYPCINK